LRGAEKDRTYHGFNPGGHFLGGDTLWDLIPAARGSKNGPGRGGRQQCRIDTRCNPMKGKAFLEHALDDGDVAAELYNILAFHLTLAPASIPPALLASVLWVLVFLQYRESFKAIFSAKPATQL
jgi:hypothetical protein